MNYSRFWYLVDLYHKKQLSVDQEIELNDFYALLNNNPELFQNLLRQAGGEENLINRLQEDFESKYFPKKKSYLLKLNPVKLAVAATLLFALSFGILFYIQTPTLKTASKAKEANILPAKDVAMLSFSSGGSIELAEEDQSHLSAKNFKVSNGVAYFNNIENEEVVTNTISTPKAGKFKVVLADGTRVWINSDTKLSFPSKFKTSERVVNLAGEAYFEVAKNLKKPFIVKSGKQVLHVLGTHFNINAYEGDASIKTTLFEGKVQVNSVGQNTKVNILPGQQTIFANSTFNLQNADLKEALAWKNGYFKFNAENIENIMLQLSRWYNVDITYKTPIINKTISAYISRDKSLKEVLDILQTTESVKFNVEGRTVYVTN